MDGFIEKSAAITLIVNTVSKVAEKIMTTKTHDMYTTIAFMAERQNEIIDLLSQVPTAKVAEVRECELTDEMKEWWDGFTEFVLCSACGTEFSEYAMHSYLYDSCGLIDLPRFCPECGAKNVRKRSDES